MKITKLILSILLLAAPALAQTPNVGRDPKALASPFFNYGKYKSTIQCAGNYGVSFLWNTFGTKLSNVEAELRDPRVNYVKIEIFNETCVSRGDCGPYELLAGYNSKTLWRGVDQDNPKLKAKLMAANQKAADWLLPRLRVDQTCRRNTFLETHATRAQAIKVESWLAPAWQGRCGSIWNPVGAKPGLPPPGFVASEGHGPSPVFEDNRCIANPDGSPPADQDWEAFFRKYAKCEMVYGWDQNDNCIDRGAGRVDPRKRQCKDTSGFGPVGKGMCEAVKPIETAPPWSSTDDISKANCASLNQTFDRDGGFIWKQSHVPGYHGTILFPAKFEKFKKVEIQKAGQRVGQVDYAPGVGFPDQADHNKKRPIWRANRDIKQYPFNVVIRGTNAKGKVHCWPLSNPRIRND